MAPTIYGLCALTWILCAFLVLRAWRASGYRLLLWSGLCFVGLAANNVLLVFDKLVLPETDLSLPRVTVAFLSMLVLAIGLVFDSK